MDTKTLREEMARVAKQMFDEGLTSSEIARRMCISESRVRAIKKTIDETENAIT